MGNKYKTYTIMKTILIKLTLEEMRKCTDDLVIELQFDGEMTTTPPLEMLHQADEPASGQPVTPDNTGMQANQSEMCLGEYLEHLAIQIESEGKVRTAETYKAAQHSFLNFRNGHDILIKDLTATDVANYQQWLNSRKVTRNTISFYMRKLRAAYNKAVNEGLTDDEHPFSHVYTGMPATAKRAVDIEVMKRLEAYQPDDTAEAFARDMFLFSFYTRGMAFVDIAHLKKADLRNGVLSYCRQKTGQRLNIRWEQPMQHIIDRYPCNDSPYLLPIVSRPGNKERGQIRHRQQCVNEALIRIGNKMKIQQHLTLYVARHTWASTAARLGIPLNIISQGMGHHSLRTTQIYLKQLDDGSIDKANLLVLDCISRGGDTVNSR